MQRLVSVDKAAELLSVSRWTIRAWIAQGKLGSAKLGSRRLVPEFEIENLIRRGHVPAHPDLSTEGQPVSAKEVVAKPKASLN
jgi:excisionase family DNA binding protein